MFTRKQTDTSGGKNCCSPTASTISHRRSPPVVVCTKPPFTAKYNPVCLQEEEKNEQTSLSHTIQELPLKKLGRNLSRHPDDKGKMTLDCDDNVTVECLARLPIQHHRTAAFTCHGLGSILGSEYLFQRRSEEGLKEPMVFVCLGDNDDDATNPSHTWFCLGKKPEKTTVSSGFWLMKVALAESFPANSKMTSVGSNIYMFNPKVYSELTSLDCGTRVWNKTESLRHGPRKIESSFLFALKDTIFVLGGCGGEGMFPESLCVTDDEPWRVVEDPLLNLHIDSTVFLIGSTITEELALWSVFSSGDKSVKHVLDAHTGMWSSEPSKLFPFVLQSCYSHTLFFGNILLRVIGRKLLWFDDEVGGWRNVIEGARAVSPTRSDFRFRRFPLTVVDAGATLVAFWRVGKKASPTNIWATELSLEKIDNVVVATVKWCDHVLKWSAAVDVLGSVCVHL
ncbi:hypothetical protein F2Q70_00030881 [Brassica cretica]|uniref:FKB95-like N-terminal Kelch domain-containing protein n=1 Tax=Brassica cretica TaxID=69181 RepID=A0A8S9FNE1_BRACR|nr:hypothetical protein F2Q70_00030881 [Brassica cretica]